MFTLSSHPSLLLYCNHTALVTFSDISLDPERVRILQSLYPTVEDIDLFVGLMTEDALDGALFGPVATSIMRDQFERYVTAE